MPVEAPIEVIAPVKQSVTVPKENRQVTVHVRCGAQDEDLLVRIWKTTYLFCAHSSHQSALLFFYDITLYPNWQIVPAGKDHVFTLVFEGLPSTCTHFHLQEVIPQSGGFCWSNISRTKTDVYTLSI
jgi:hypothetical protein